MDDLLNKDELWSSTRNKINRVISDVFPSGSSSARVDEYNVPRLDEYGALREEPHDALSLEPLLKDVAPRNIKFGAMWHQAEYLDASSDDHYRPGYLDTLRENCEFIVFAQDFLPNRIEASPNVFETAAAATAIERAHSLDLPWRMHLLNYPAHGASWENATNITSANYKAVIDRHLEAVRAIPGAGTAFNIDVTNELFDGFNASSGSYRNNAWYAATAPGLVPASAPNAGSVAGYNIPDFAAYLFIRARELWPTTPLCFCHDEMEQLTSNYYVIEADALATFLEKAIPAGIPIDVFNMQCHLKLEKGFNPDRFKAFLQRVKATGVKLMIGEIDVREDRPGILSPSERDDRCGDLLKRVLDVALPFVDDGQPVLTYTLSDRLNFWEPGTRPGLLDFAYRPKPTYDALRRAFQGEP